MNYKSIILKIFPKAQDYHFKIYQLFKRLFVFLRYMPGNSIWFGPPRGLYHNAESFNQTFPNKQIISLIAKEEEVYKREVLKTQSQLVKVKFEKLSKACSKRRNTYILHNARYLSGDGGTVITHDDKIFIPCSPLKNEWYPEKHQSFYILTTPKLLKLDKVVLIDTVCSEKNYCHWLRDHLIRFLYLKDLDIDYSQYTLVSSNVDIGYQKFAYQKLRACGFVFKDYVATNVIKHFEANEIIVPPYLTDAFNADYFGFTKDEWSFLNSIFKDNDIKQSEINRIFLSRRRANRTSADEAKLIEILTQKHQFKEVFLEDFTISEQAHIFHNAKVIVGLHGAGFTNLCFCLPETTVIEIFSPDFIVSDFWDIANQMELNYFAYCEDELYKDVGSYRLAREESTKFDVEKLMHFITKIVTS